MATHENPRRHLILLIALLLIIVLSPFIVTLRHGVTVLNIVGAAVLLSATYAVSERKNFLAIAIILSAISIITTWLLVAFPAYWLVVVSHGSLVALIAFFSFTNFGLCRAQRQNYIGQNLRCFLCVPAVRLSMGVCLRTSGRIAAGIVCRFK